MCEQHQLKLIKINTQLTAKSEWYDWKLQWVEQLSNTANNGAKELEEVCSSFSERMKLLNILT